MGGRESVLLKPVGMLFSVLCSGERAQQTVVSSFSSADEEGQLSPSLLPCGVQTNNWLLSLPARLVQHASQHNQGAQGCMSEGSTGKVSIGRACMDEPPSNPVGGSLCD